MFKKLFLAAALVCATHMLYAQTDSLSADKPKAFSFEGSYVGDFYGNATGGIRKGVGFLGMADIAVGFDTEAARWWKGGQFFINGAAIHGKSLSADYVGDLQMVSNIDGADNRSHVYMYELWFRQQFGFRREGSGLSLTLGLQDLNAEFMASECAAQFLNGSFGVPSAIGANIPVPIFPITGLGVTARWDINKMFAWQVAVFDGDQTPFEEGNPGNLKWKFSKSEGLLAMTELHGRFNIGGKEGVYKIGGHYHSGVKNWGVYAIIDQELYENDRHRVDIFAQATVAPRGRNDNDYYIGVGSNLYGVFSKRKRDALGLAVAHAGLHKLAHRHETTLEFYYKYQFNDHIALQPDLQYVINPSGTDTRLKNALAGILRLHLSF